tara:strand:- start:1237 stop:1371 length:135 start_codon:yes stop_codon:yes gene_type:complete
MLLTPRPGGVPGVLRAAAFPIAVKLRAADTIITNEKLLEVKTNE